MRKPIAATFLASVLLLAGCTSPLVETGTQLNSKVPKNIDSYEFITQEQTETSGFCTGNPTQEGMSTKTEYVGFFHYLEAKHQLPAADGECNQGAFAQAVPDGVVFIALFNSTDVDLSANDNDFAERLGKVCEPQVTFNDIMTCHFVTGNNHMRLTAYHEGTEQQFRDKYQTLATNFGEELEINFP